jgi:hypothetical protein
MFCCGFVDYTAGKRKSKEENAGNFSFYMLLSYMRSILLFLISQNLLKRRSWLKKNPGRFSIIYVALAERNIPLRNPTTRYALLAFIKEKGMK